jgi:hypothetical protein
MAWSGNGPGHFCLCRLNSAWIDCVPLQAHPAAMDTNSRLDHLEHSVGELTIEVRLLCANSISRTDFALALKPIHAQLALIKNTQITRYEFGKLTAEVGKFRTNVMRWFVFFNLAQAALTAAMIKYL